MVRQESGVIYLFPVLKGMKRFIKGLMIMCLLTYAFAFLLDACITTGLRRTDIRKYAVWNDIYNKEINADLVVIGSSRVWCGYNTYLLDSLLCCNSYNLGIDGHPLDFQLIRYNTYRRFNRAPEVLLINVDFLSTLHNTADPQYEREQFFPYVCDKTLMSLVSETKHISVLDRFVPLYRYYGYREEIENGIASFFGKKSFKDGGLHKGFRGEESVWEGSRVSTKDTIMYATINTDVIDLLDSFVSSACDEGISVFFVKSPVYIPLFSRFGNVTETDSIFNGIAGKYNVPVLDYYYSDVSADSTNFTNSSHLNGRGAELFTIELCRDLGDYLD